MTRHFVSFLLLLTIGWLLSGCSTEPQATGVLMGKVTIGPIVPVERPGVKTPVPCEVYEARKILIYDEKGRKQIKQVDIGCDGNYLIELVPDIYLVDINYIGIDHSEDVPETVEIRPKDTLKFDIDIDTGIR
jgi:hypothetical protein